MVIPFGRQSDISERTKRFAAQEFVRWGAMARISRPTVIAVAVSAVVMAALGGAHNEWPRNAIGSVSHVELGVTHTQFSADEWNAPAATDRAKQILRSMADLENQHIMGWGADTPSPAPGVRDWRTLDQRMRLIGASEATPVITLCCAPDWMKGGEPGTTDWSRLEEAPSPDHYDDFAELAADVARRYPQVRYYIVWNELKGFYDTDHERWDIESYTTLYNKVYLRLKAVDPTLKVGGPYVVMESWSSSDASHPSSFAGPWGVMDQRALDAVNNWLSRADGADFIAIDGSSATNDKGLIVAPQVANQKFAAVTRWLRTRTALPVWWAELYPAIDREEDWASPWRAAVALDAILSIADAGGSVVLLWQPEGRPDSPSVALWSTTNTSSGGQAGPLVEMLVWVRNAWRAGRRVEHRWDGAALVVTAGADRLVADESGSATTWCWFSCR